MKLSSAEIAASETWMRIAIIEDNAALAAGLAHQLRRAGHSVDVLDDGEAGAEHLAFAGADVIILDVNLPRRDGLDLLRELRRRGDATPVLILSARGETADRVAGLDAGADDYLVKPFEFDELAARLRALARRRQGDAAIGDSVGALRFDRAGRRLLTGANVDLGAPRRELAVLECLLDRRGRLVSKTAIADHVFGVGADVDEKVIEVYVSRLRKRLADHGVAIRSARGLGYMLEEE